MSEYNESHEDNSLDAMHERLEAVVRSGRLAVQRSIIQSEILWFGDVTRHVNGVGRMTAREHRIIGDDKE